VTSAGGSGVLVKTRLRLYSSNDIAGSKGPW